jgi:hypothetical protein
MLPLCEGELCVSMTIKLNLDPSLALRMTKWVSLVILRTEGTKNLGFEFLIQKSSSYEKVSFLSGLG